MNTADTFKGLALSFNGVEQLPHFNRTAFKITGRKIFASLLEEEATANLLLSPADQKTYTAYDEAMVYPVSGSYGLQGWTTFDLNKVPVELLLDALLAAYNGVLQTTPVKGKRK